MFTRSREDAKMMDLEAAASDVIDVSLRLHRDLGPGLLESVYETVLAAKLSALGHSVERQMPVSFTFEGLSFDAAFRVDLVVAGALLINFGGATLKEGLRRIVNGHTAFASSRLRVNQ